MKPIFLSLFAISLFAQQASQPPGVVTNGTVTNGHIAVYDTGPTRIKDGGAVPTGHPSVGPYPAVQVSDGNGGFGNGGCTEDLSNALHTCVNTNSLATTSLTNGALTGGTSWEFNQDFASAGDAAVYTHSTGGGYVRQQLNLFAIPAYANRWYQFSYVTSASGGAAPTCILLSTFPNDVVSLPTVNGSHSVTFLSSIGPTIFTVSCTSTTAGTVTFDTFSLREMLGGEVQVGGRLTAKYTVLGPTVVAQLPAAGTGNNNEAIVVSDGASASDCTVGSGTTKVFCISNGSAWVALGGASPGGSDTQVQFNDSGAFGGNSGFTFNKATGAIAIGASVPVVVQPAGVLIGNTQVGISGTMSPGSLLVGNNTRSGDGSGQDGWNYPFQVNHVFTGNGNQGEGLELAATFNPDIDMAGAFGIVLSTTFEGTHDFADSGGNFPTNLYTTLGSYTPGNVGTLTNQYYNTYVNASHVTLSNDVWVSSPLAENGGVVTTRAAIYVDDQTGFATNTYSFWDNARGVFAIKDDNNFDGIYQATARGYNPQFAKYVPGDPDYERGVCQWESNTYVCTTEASGTGTLRPFEIDGSEFDLGASAVSPAGSGQRFLCITTAGKVVSSATACVGT